MKRPIVGGDPTRYKQSLFAGAGVGPVGGERDRREVNETLLMMTLSGGQEPERATPALPAERAPY